MADDRTTTTRERPVERVREQLREDEGTVGLTKTKSRKRSGRRKEQIKGRAKRQIVRLNARAKQMGIGLSPVNGRYTGSALQRRELGKMIRGVRSKEDKKTTERVQMTNEGKLESLLLLRATNAWSELEQGVQEGYARRFLNVIQAYGKSRGVSTRDREAYTRSMLQQLQNRIRKQREGESDSKRSKELRNLSEYAREIESLYERNPEGYTLAPERKTKRVRTEELQLPARIREPSKVINVPADVFARMTQAREPFPPLNNKMPKNGRNEMQTIRVPGKTKGTFVTMKVPVIKPRADGRGAERPEFQGILIASNAKRKTYLMPNGRIYHLDTIKAVPRQPSLQERYFRTKKAGSPFTFTSRGPAQEERVYTSSPSALGMNAWPRGQSLAERVNSPEYVAKHRAALQQNEEMIAARKKWLRQLKWNERLYHKTIGYTYDEMDAGVAGKKLPGIFKRGWQAAVLKMKHAVRMRRRRSA